LHLFDLVAPAPRHHVHHHEEELGHQRDRDVTPPREDVVRHQPPDERDDWDHHHAEGKPFPTERREVLVPPLIYAPHQ
jgi:hypothetical protein